MEGNLIRAATVRERSYVPSLSKLLPGVIRKPKVDRALATIRRLVAGIRLGWNEAVLAAFDVAALLAPALAISGDQVTAVALRTHQLLC